jgi:hypothetical protein
MDNQTANPVSDVVLKPIPQAEAASEARAEQAPVASETAAAPAPTLAIPAILGAVIPAPADDVTNEPALPVASASPVTDGAAPSSLLSEVDALLDGKLTAFATESPEDALKSGTTEAHAAIAANKVRIIVKALRSMEQNIANIIRLLEDEKVDEAASAVLPSEPLDATLQREVEMAGVRPVDGRVIEGVFDGQSMVGSDGKVYTVPPNYASKSKLVEGDLLKLTITQKGSFIYKQIGPIERSRIVAELGFDSTNGDYYAAADSRRWSVIKASVTYFKGEPGDEIVLLVPKAAPSKWAAVENIIKRNPVI